MMNGTGSLATVTFTTFTLLSYVSHLFVCRDYGSTLQLTSVAVTVGVFWGDRIMNPITSCPPNPNLPEKEPVTSNEYY